MSLTGNVRARRPASPPPEMAYTSPSPSTSSQRFPHPRDGHMDADERRAAASKGFGPSRSKQFPSGGLNITPGEWKMLVGVLVLACAVRFYKIAEPNSVVFDEVHFGKFASRYIRSRYFMDVHPPLAKLLITLAAFVGRYDGHFSFKDIAMVYDDKVPYVTMRMLPAALGVATVPLAYLTLRMLDCRATTSLLAALFIIFENGLITQSRHILLDSPLLFFTALTVFFWTGFCNEDKHQPFTKSWWTWLALSGTALGATLSCKWVGLFTVATIGFNTVYHLWNLLGDSRVAPKTFVRHFTARAICLIAIPMVFYMSMFGVHFAILRWSGEGDGFMSSEFQHTLKGRAMSDTFADVAIGSTVTLRHVNTQGGYLHSHAHNYPTGSKQQQITLYPHRDSNNDWILLNATSDGVAQYDYLNEPLEYIKPGARLRLRHVSTEKNLHSHDHRPPVSEVDFQNEVSAYGMKNFTGDGNDDWIVEIVRGHKSDKESSKRLRTLRTVFRLKHPFTGCYLFSHKVKLPDWGFEQQEVTCNKNAVLANSLWYIETSKHPNLPADAPKVNYKLPGFFAKFWELQKVMWTTNAGLTDRHTYDSRPDAWPRLRRGINFWVKDHKQIYLIGNPFIWYLSTLAVAAYIGVRAILILRAKRGYKDFNNTKLVKYDNLCGFFFMGWALHYGPFFLMARQLFLHHYFPALYFAILLWCVVFDLITSTLRPKIRLQIAACLVVFAIWNFYYLAPLAYGLPWTRAKCNKAKWLKTWDFSCNDFHTEYSHYKLPVAVATPSQPVAAAAPAKPNVVAAGPEQQQVKDDSAKKEKEKEKSDLETTAARAGIPEPGRDIFEGQPIAAEPQSSAPPAAGLPPRDDERTVAKGEREEEESNQLEKKISVVGAAESKEGEKEKDAVGGGDDDTTPKEEAEGPKPKPKPNPVVEGREAKEERAEAEKVANELYPEAAAPAA